MYSIQLVLVLFHAEQLNLVFSNHEQEKATFLGFFFLAKQDFKL